MTLRGLVPWPKLFHNLRSSCETQWLKDGERADLVANWIGHSIKVQNENYVQHTAEDIDAFNEKVPFSDAIKSGTPGGTEPMRTDENPNEFSVPLSSTLVEENAVDQCFSTSDGSKSIPRVGLEPTRSYRNPRF